MLRGFCKVLCQKTRQTDVPCEDLSGISADWHVEPVPRESDDLSRGPLHHSSEARTALFVLHPHWNSGRSAAYLGEAQPPVRGAAAELHRLSLGPSKWQPSSGRLKEAEQRAQQVMCKETFSLRTQSFPFSSQSWPGNRLLPAFFVERLANMEKHAPDHN